MIHQIVHDNTGAIRFSVTASALMDPSALDPGLTVVETASEVDPLLNYVVSGQVIPRPTFGRFSALILAMGQESTLTGLPDPTTVTVNGTAQQVTDGEVILPWSGVGRFNVVVRAWPYLDYAVAIECV